MRIRTGNLPGTQSIYLWLCYDYCDFGCYSYVSESTTVREPLVGHTTQQAHGVSPHGCQATPDMSTPRRAKSPTMKLVQQTERYCSDPYALLSDLGRKHITGSESVPHRTLNHTPSMQPLKRKGITTFRNVHIFRFDVICCDTRPVSKDLHSTYTQTRTQTCSYAELYGFLSSHC